MICMSRRSRRSSPPRAASSSWPSKRTVPESGSINRRNIRPRVLLPEPDSPTSPTVSPASILSDTSLTARTRVVEAVPKALCPELKDFTRCSACTNGMPPLVTNAGPSDLLVGRKSRQSNSVRDCHLGILHVCRSVLTLCCPARSLHAQLHEVRPSAMEYIQVKGSAHMAGWGSLLGKLPNCPRRTSRSFPHFGDMGGLFSIQK